MTDEPAELDGSNQSDGLVELWRGMVRCRVVPATVARLTAYPASADTLGAAPTFLHACASQPRGTT